MKEETYAKSIKNVMKNSVSFSDNIKEGRNTDFWIAFTLLYLYKAFIVGLLLLNT